MRHHTKTTAIAAALTAALALGACSSSGDKDASSKKGADAKKVLATVGERNVTAAEFEAYLNFKKISVRSPEQLDQELEQYARREALADAARLSGKLDQAALDAELNEFRKEMLISRYFDEYLRTSVTREDIERYYTEHAGDYQVRRVRAAHILARVPSGSEEDVLEAKKQKIDEALAKLDAGEDFADVAMALSEDRVSANRGGDMGWVREGAIAPKFSEIAFSLEQGKHSRPVLTPFGYHIIKVLEGPKLDKKPLSAVEGDIRFKLRGEAKEAETKRLLEGAEPKLDRADWMPSNAALVQEKNGAPEEEKP